MYSSFYDKLVLSTSKYQMLVAIIKTENVVDNPKPSSIVQTETSTDLIIIISDCH